MQCPACNGAGNFWLSLQHRPKCSVCKGQGRVVDEPERTEMCSICLGTCFAYDGFEKFLCTECGGWGKVRPLVSTLTSSDDIYVFYVEAGKARTAQLNLEEIFHKVSGEIRICDPYYGAKSLYRLDSLKQCKPIRFLTQKADGNETLTVSSALQVWKQQHQDVEFRRHVGRDLHDRFVLSDEELILLGHGLKDVGNRDSFIIRIGHQLAGDLIQTVRESFDAKWKAATPIV
jgi:hypothetical protein